MALSPADFAAYSRATGTPYPEDPEERAALAPSVTQFRRNQLRAPEQESNLPGILGGTALGLGVLAGGAYAARRLGLGKARVPASTETGLTSQGTQDVRTIGTSNRQRAAEELTRQARAERMPGVVQTDLSAVDKLLNDPGLRSQVEYEQELASLTPEGLKQFRGQESRARNQYRTLITEIGDEIIEQERTSNQVALSAQALNALESGEDQVTGRTLRGVQRNEDLDVSQVNELAKQTGSVQVAASMTPDGIPVDQTDPWGQATVPQVQQVKQASTPLLPAAASSPRKKAQQFLQSRFEALGDVIPGRYRRERAMGMDTEIAEAAELYAATGDPSVLSRFSTTPSSPVSVNPTVQMDINSEKLPTSQFYKPTGYPENTGDLLERDIELTNKISSLGEQKQFLVAKNKELGEQELMLRSAMERDPEQGGAYTKMFGQLKFEQQNLPDPSSLDVDLGDALAERDFIRGQINSLESLGSTYKLSDFQEGVRPFYEYDPQGNIIPQTLELRGGRRSADLEPKTGGGRLAADYDPGDQTGSTRGVYGVEQTSRRSGESTRPTQMTMNELVREGLDQASASPEGDVPLPPSLEQMTERKPTSIARRSIDASQIVRQAIIEGRDPQMILRQRGFNV